MLRVPAKDALPSSVASGLPQWAPNSGQHKFWCRAVTDWLVQDSQPSYAVESAGFREMMRKIQPTFNLPSRTYFQQVCLLSCL